MTRDNNFDLIRLLAALEVMISHSREWLHLPVASHWLWFPAAIFPGVPVFFGISGFLVSRSYRSSSSLGAYFVHRALRIYPGLWANILALVLMCIVAGNLLHSFFPSLTFLGWLATFLVTGSDYATKMIWHVAWWNSHGAYRYFPSGVLWTLSVELLFYVLVPIIFSKWLASRKLQTLSALGWSALSLWCLWHISPQEHPGFTQHYLWVFLAGALLNLWWPKIKWLFDSKALYWLLVYIAANLWFPGIYYQTATPVAVGGTLLLVGTVISMAYTLPQVGRIVRRDVSYGVYLWHMPIIWTMVLFGLQGSWLMFAIALALTLLVALGARILVEEPALRLKGKTISRWRVLELSRP